MLEVSIFRPYYNFHFLSKEQAHSISLFYDELLAIDIKLIKDLRFLNIVPIKCISVAADLVDFDMIGNTFLMTMPI